MVGIVDFGLERRLGENNGSFLLFLGDGPRLLAAVITIGVERKINNHERF